MVKTAVFFIAAVIDAAILTSIVSTQLVLHDIKGFGLAVSFGDRLDATIHDLVGLAVPLLIIIGLGFLVALPIARYASLRIGGKSTWWFLAAGFLSVPATLLIIRFFLGLTVLASARTWPGMFLVACCGMAGASVFVYLRAKFGRPVKADV